MALSLILAEAFPKIWVSVLFACLVVTAIRSWLSYRRLRHIKGPWLASFSSLWLFYHTSRSRLYLAGEQALLQYGSLVRIAPNVVLTNDPTLIRAMGAPRSGFWRSHYWKGTRVDAETDHLLSTTDETKHATLRAKVQPGYTGREVTTLEADIDARVIELLDLIRREYTDQERPFDFARLAGYFTLDALAAIAFGEPMGFLNKNEDLYNYHKVSAALFPVVECSMHHRSIRWIVQLLQKIVAQPSDIGMGAIVTKVHQAVRERFTNKPGTETPSDMLSSFIRHGLTQQECESEAILQILAGADSTSHAIRITFWHILNTPAAYVRLIAEIDTAVQKGQVSFPVIKNREAQDLPYLRACILEGLRIFQPLNGISTRLSPSPDGYVHNGVHIPAGTEVGMSNHSMQRRKDIYGTDADTFRPDRWFDDDEERLKMRERVQEMAFGSGKTSCLGKDIAWIELRKTIFELFRTFEFAIVNPLASIKTKSNGVVVQEGMYVRAWPRKNEYP